MMTCDGQKGAASVVAEEEDVFRFLAALMASCFREIDARKHTRL